MRAAFESFATIGYKYKPKVSETNGNNPPEVKSESKVILSETFENTNNTVFAQPIANGFQLVDNTPKVVMKIFKTSNADIFIASKEDIQGVMLLKDNHWLFEFYRDGKLNSQIVQVKF